MTALAIKKKVSKEMLYKDYAAIWLEYCCETLAELKENTIVGYQSKLNIHILPILGSLTLSEIGRDEILSFVDYLKKRKKNNGKPLSSSTVRHTFRIFSKSLTDAVLVFKVLDMNPCHGIRIKSRDSYKYHWLENEREIHFFLECWKETEFYLPVYITIMQGLRRSELLALQWKDIDLGRATMTVHRVVVVGKDKQLIYREGLKNDSTEKILLIPPSLLQYLKELKARKNYADDDFVVTNSHGKPWNPSSFSKKYGELKKQLPIDHGLRFHDLRHSNASYLYNQGVDVKVIAQRLGHSDIMTTLKFYTHTRLDDQQRAVGKLDF